MKILFTSLLFFISLGSIFSQDNCLKSYLHANDLYEVGRVDSALKILQPCLTDKRWIQQEGKDTRIAVYQLVARIYLDLDFTTKAEEYIQKVLIEKPDYQAKDQDLSKFKSLVKNNYTLPKFTIGLMIGANTTFPKVLQEHPVLERNNTAGFGSQKYKPGLGFQIRTPFSYRFSNSLAVQIAPTFANSSFRLETYYNWLSQSDNMELYYAYKMTLTYLEIPVSLRLSFFNRKKYRPYIQAGIYYQYLMSANKTQSSALKREGNNVEIRSIPGLPTTVLMHQHLLGTFAGLGIAKEIKNFSLNFLVNYQWIPQNIIKDENRYLNHGIIHASVYEYYHTNDDLSMQKLEFSIGCVYHINNRIFKKK